MFIECPSAWALRYHYGYKPEWKSEKADKGIAFEDEVCQLIYGGFDDIHNGLEAEERNAAKQIADLINRIIPGDVQMQKQVKSDEYVGYMDFWGQCYDEKNYLVVDLKTTNKVFKSTPAHVLRQLVFYRDFFPENKPDIVVVYAVIQKRGVKIIVHTNHEGIMELCRWEQLCDERLWIGSHYIYMAGLQNMAAERSMRRVLEDPEYIKALPVNAGHFYMGDYDEKIIEDYLKGELRPLER